MQSGPIVFSSSICLCAETRKKERKRKRERKRERKKEREKERKTERKKERERKKEICNSSILTLRIQKKTNGKANYFAGKKESLLK